ncbi:MAG: 50S ribosome-binding GTPase [Fuerstiella sp.]|nr:50S ribosome-binding GTPase [Fuerstiella sp.]
MNGDVKVTQLTASGRGAVAVIRVDMAGAETSGRFDSCFQAANGMLPSHAAVGRILYGMWDGEDVVVVRVGEHEWEIHCHGGDAAVARISQQLTVVDQPLDSLLLERVDDTSEGRLETAVLEQLLKCRTRRTASFLLSQYTGGLRRFLTTLSDQEDAATNAAVLADFLRWRTFASHLTTPWRAAVIGQPNAGKSSLLNAIIGYERSIVFDQPGTTRDLVEAELTLDGWPFLLIDTAGIRDRASNDIEAIGVESARGSVASCDACLLVVDSQKGWTNADAELLAAIPADCQSVILWNKTDLSHGGPAPLPQMSDATKIIETSAIDGIGIEDVITWLPTVMVPSSPDDAQGLPVVEALATELADYADDPSSVSLHDVLARWL